MKRIAAKLALTTTNLVSILFIYVAGSVTAFLTAAFILSVISSSPPNWTGIPIMAWFGAAFLFALSTMGLVWNRKRSALFPALALVVFVGPALSLPLWRLATAPQPPIFGNLTENAAPKTELGQLLMRAPEDSEASNHQMLLGVASALFSIVLLPVSVLGLRKTGFLT